MKPITLIIVFSLLTLMLKAQSVDNNTPELQNSQSKGNIINAKTNNDTINNSPVISESSNTNKNSNSANKPELLNMSDNKSKIDTVQKVDSLKVEVKPLK
ncbi:MAG: hypothetical protein V1904_10545 [Bacteroidota bacterium]